MKKSVIFFFLVFYSTVVGAEKTITLQTYYPAPQGAYNSLRSKKMCVGAQCFAATSPYQVANNNLIIEGDVGIGTDAPDERLHVDGNIKSNAFLGGTFRGEEFLYTSDEKLKERVKDLDNSLQKVLALRGVSFYFKNQPDVKKIGLIAQEVEKVVPEVVATNQEGIKSVEYGNLIALLIEAIKEQQKEIDMLKSQLPSKEVR